MICGVERGWESNEHWGRVGAGGLSVIYIHFHPVKSSLDSNLRILALCEINTPHTRCSRDALCKAYQNTRNKHTGGSGPGNCILVYTKSATENEVTFTSDQHNDVYGKS